MTDKKEKELIEGCPWRHFDVYGEPVCKAVMITGGCSTFERPCTAPDCGPMYFAMGAAKTVPMETRLEKYMFKILARVSDIAQAKTPKDLERLMGEAKKDAREINELLFKGGKITPAASGDEGKVDITAIDSEAFLNKKTTGVGEAVCFVCGSENISWAALKFSRALQRELKVKSDHPEPEKSMWGIFEKIQDRTSKDLEMIKAFIKAEMMARKVSEMMPPPQHPQHPTKTPLLHLYDEKNQGEGYLSTTEPDKTTDAAIPQEDTPSTERTTYAKEHLPES